MNANIKDYNSIQEAVDDCAQKGGGRVTVPKGDWNTGKIHLKSNIELRLEKGARLIFSHNPNDYLPVVFTRWEGAECYNYSPLIYAKDCKNIKITGEGTLYGNGEKWWDWKRKQGAAAKELVYAESNGVKVENRVYGNTEAALRPQFIQLINCTDILLEGFTITDGPQWTIHPVYCENITIRNLTVLTHGHNTDGLNPDSCKNVLIEGCTFDTGDDCIAINSGINEDGIRVNKPCENVEIRNCKMIGGHGAITIGSAVSGGVKNIYAHDCKMSGAMQGIRIKSMRGRGGYVDGARFENIEINDVTEQAIQITMFYSFSTVKPKSDTPTECKNIEISNIKGRGAKTGIEIIGLKEKLIENVRLQNIDLTAKSAMTLKDIQSITMDNVTVKEQK